MAQRDLAQAQVQLHKAAYLIVCECASNGLQAARGARRVQSVDGRGRRLSTRGTLAGCSAPRASTAILPAQHAPFFPATPPDPHRQAR